MESLLAGQTWNRYRVDAYLGGGGMADVYLVTHVELGVRRALKVLKRAGEDVTPRLVREGQVQATLMHPNLVPVLELIRVHGHPALIMDYVEGVPLDALAAREPLSLEQLDYVARGMLDGMIAAHRRGVIHRDLKPSNVMLDTRDDPPVARIMDFGLAKAIAGEGGATSTASGVVMGTPRYMAPEQMVDAKSVDERADVWSMGAMLYELVTGCVAFPGDSLVETLRCVDRGEFEPVTEARPDVPARMAAAIEEALVRDLDERCPSMQALRDLWVGDVRHIEAPTFPTEDLARAPTPLPPRAAAAEETLDPAAQSTLDPALIRAGSTTLVPPTASMDAETAEVLRRASRRTKITGLVAGIVGLVAVVAIGAAVWPLVMAAPPEGEGTDLDQAARDIDAILGQADAVVGAINAADDEVGEGTIEAAVRARMKELEGAPEQPPAEPIPAGSTASSTPTAKTSTPKATSQSASTTQVASTPSTPSTATAKPDTTATASPPPPEPAAAQPKPSFPWTAKHDGKTAVDMKLRSTADGSTHTPGQVPSGDYVLMVRWKDSKTWADTMAVSVRGPLTVSCNGLTYKCALQ